MKGKGMNQDSMKGKPFAKQMDEGGEGEGEEEEEEEEEEGTEKACGGDHMSKGELTTDDLQKSLDRLEEIAKSDDPPSRREALLARASEGELSKSERDELFEILGGGEATPVEQPGDEIVKSMESNEELAKALDVSDYLQEQHDELVKSLRIVGEEIRKSDNRHHEFGLVMARAVHDIGTMVKSLAEQVEALGGQPARAPKSRGIRTQPSQVLQKSFGGETTSAEDRLSKSDVLNGLDALMQESMSKGMDGRTEFGEDITMATAKYEQTHQISKPMLDAVMAWRKGARAAAH